MELFNGYVQLASKTEYIEHSDYLGYEILMMLLGIGIIVTVGWVIYELISWIVRKIVGND